MMFKFLCVLLFITEILIVFLFALICRKKNKTQLHYAFLSNLGFLILWCTFIILHTYTLEFNGDVAMYFEYAAYIGVCFAPVSLLLTGMIYAHTSISFTPKYLLLLIVPTVSLLVLWTNDFHNLFYVKHSFYIDEIIFGSYFIIHTLYSYVCVIIGLYYFIRHSFKNLGILSKQAMWIFLGFLVPLIVNILATFGIVHLTDAATPIAFSFLVVCCFFALWGYDFLEIIPIALRSVVDSFSDSFIVLNDKLVIVDYNRAFLLNFREIFKIEKYYNLMDAVDSNKSVEIDKLILIQYIHEASKTGKTVAFEKRFNTGIFDKYFTVEITPIVLNSQCVGFIMMLKDITQFVDNMEIINASQAVLRKEKHDYVNHLNTLAAMCMTKNPDALDKIENYTRKLISNTATFYKLFNTGNSYVDGLLSAKSNLGAEKNIHLDVDLDFPLTGFDVDDVDLTSIIGNIVDNAFDAIIMDESRVDTDRKRVSIYTYSQNDKCYISISNNGPRIPENNLDSIFENRFSTKPNREGTRGLGLFITKELMAKNAGMIFVQSSDEGTEFLLEFNMKMQNRLDQTFAS